MIAPFVAAILAPLVQKLVPAASGGILALVPAAMFVGLCRYVGPVTAGHSVSGGIDWVPAFNIHLSFFVDGLSLTFALLIAGVGTLVILYSGAYLAGHPHQGRFFMFMFMFMGAMLGIVLADSMVALYSFWELTTVTSFLLIGFDHARQAARRAALQALIITGGGGLVLLLGFVALYEATGSWDLSVIRALPTAITAVPTYPLIFVLFAVGAFTKSAQFPFQFWLPNAMEAPTPVSAYLHSATMVQAGVYLLARMSPVLGGTALWSNTLVVVGGITLLWGAVSALKQTDLKQMLAQSTLASLGLLVVLLGIGTAGAIAAAVVYFIAHALYKAGLFLVAGVIDHETGARDITVLGGLREKMAASFIAAILAAISMFGLPPAIGYLAKEAMYESLGFTFWPDLIAIAALVIGNALLCAVALAFLAKPFLGPLIVTPKSPHEGALSMWAPPVLLGVLGIAAAVLTDIFAHTVLVPMASAITNMPVVAHLGFAVNFATPVVWLSLLTWGIGGLTFWRLEGLRAWLRRLDTGSGWSFDRGFDAIYFALVRVSGKLTRFWHHGRLELYLVVVFVMLALALIVPLLALGGAPVQIQVPRMTVYEWGVVGLAILGLGAVLTARSRLIAIVSLGIQGFAVALIFMLYGAPDLSFTQFMVEILSVVILALVMTRLRLDLRDRREFGDLLRDGTLSLFCGVGVVLVLLAVLARPLNTRLSDFFEAHSLAIAHGHNIVNVIIVDFRGLDTLGEISVVMTAGIAILALIRTQRTNATPENAAPKRRRRRKVPPAVAPQGKAQ